MAWTGYLTAKLSSISLHHFIGDVCSARPTRHYWNLHPNPIAKNSETLRTDSGRGHLREMPAAVEADSGIVGGEYVQQDGGNGRRRVHLIAALHTLQHAAAQQARLHTRGEYYDLLQ